MKSKTYLALANILLIWSMARFSYIKFSAEKSEEYKRRPLGGKLKLFFMDR